jgi:transcriptional regulator with XRE-family HTH domain
MDRQPGWATALRPDSMRRSARTMVSSVSPSALATAASLGKASRLGAARGAEARRGARRADETDAELGQRLWQLRLRRGVTRREAALSLGVTAQQIQKYELGQDRLSIGRLVRLAALLETPLPVLIDGLGDPGGPNAPAPERARRHAESCALMQSFALLDRPELREMVLSLAAKLAALPQRESMMAAHALNELAALAPAARRGTPSAS